MYSHDKFVSLIGYDERHTKKHGCPVVTACAVFKDSHGDNFIGIIHHGVYNKNSATTLLSEFLLRKNGLIVDSVSHKHWVSETEYGQ